MTEGLPKLQLWSRAPHKSITYDRGTMHQRRDLMNLAFHIAEISGETGTGSLYEAMAVGNKVCQRSC